MNVLSSEQTELCWRFARKSVEAPFQGIEWHRSAVTGSPVLAGVLAWIDCSIATIVDAGDHHFVIGRVVQLQHVAREQEQ